MHRCSPSRLSSVQKRQSGMSRHKAAHSSQPKMSKMTVMSRPLKSISISGQVYFPSAVVAVVVVALVVVFFVVDVIVGVVVVVVLQSARWEKSQTDDLQSN